MSLDSFCYSLSFFSATVGLKKTGFYEGKAKRSHPWWQQPSNLIALLLSTQTRNKKPRSWKAVYSTLGDIHSLLMERFPHRRQIDRMLKAILCIIYPTGSEVKRITGPVN